jgi:hypothetical protein
MSRFKYGMDFFNRKYLTIHLYRDEEMLEVESEVQKENFDRLVMSTGNMPNLEFLSECLVGGPKRLLIQGGVESLSGLERLTNLIDFQCDLPMDKPYPDFGKLVNLEKCFLDWDKKYDAKNNQNGLFTLPKLKNLTLRHWSKPDCTEIAKLTQLETIDLRQGQLTSLEGVQNSFALKELSLAYLPKLVDISRLEGVGNLEKIHIENCPAISDFSSLTRLKKIRHIHLDKVKAEFQNLKWLDGMNQIEKICLSDAIVDIDWKILFNHPSLINVAMSSHDGYGVSDSEILEIAKSASRKVVNFKRLGTKKNPSFVFDLE